MTWANYDDALEQLQAAGLQVQHLEIGNGRPVRCYVDGDREKRGWYWLSDIELDRDGSRERFIIGSYGIWRGNDKGAIKIKLPTRKDRPTISAQERRAIAARHAENARRAAAMRQAEAERAAAKAANAWRQYVKDGSSDYLVRKGVGAHGVRFSPSGNGTMAVPMADAAGRIWGLQIIRGKDRGNKLEKQYWPKGLSKQGRFHLIGAAMAGGVLLVAEGYATAATLHEATGLPVAVAFDANNLMPVAQALAKAFRGVRLLICADDDYLQKCRACHHKTPVADPVCARCGEPHGQTNPGVTAANAAAVAVAGAVCVPIFPGDRAGKKLTDFNDLLHWQDGGGPLLLAQINAAIQAAGWEAARVAPSRGAPIPGGEGESRPRAVSVMPLDEAVARFMPLDDGTGKFLFDSWTQRIVHKDQMLALLPAGVRWDDVKRHPEWAARGSYYLDQVGFDPAGEDSNVKLNLWTGWPTEPAAGCCERLLELLQYQTSGENHPDLYDWVLKWLAYPLQHPGAKMQTALVCHGPQGTGKSIFFEAVAKIYGDYGVVLNQGAIEDKFNADWASRKLFIVADEIVARQELHHLKNQLKTMITGEWIRVNPKNLPAYRERNHANLVFLSNEHTPVALETDDRRHAVWWTPGKLSEAFYGEVGEEIANGGLAALHQYLLDLDLGDFRPWTKPPLTRAKQQLIDIGRDSVAAFLDEWQQGDAGLPFCPCKSSALYRAYLTWCRAEGERFPRSSKQFVGHIDKLPGWYRGHKSIWQNEAYAGLQKRARVVVPCTAAMEVAVQVPGVVDHRQPADKTEGEWLTDCVLAFDSALEGMSAG